jgi:translation initiation factor 3 subunit C
MMVTLGLSAFRQGRINDAHQCLADICSGKVRELLAQGVSLGRFSDKSTEQEKMEKRRQIPYHQHINLDLLEATHLISAMLLEVPNMASGTGKVGGRRRIISRSFRRNFDHYERQVFTSAMPEQTRDFIMCAAKNLMKGDWKKCSQLLASMDVWQLVPGDEAALKIKQMIVERTKLEGLRTYLFAYSSNYDSLSLTQLCSMFEMEKNDVHCVISKMIINQELYASLDQPTGSIVLRKVEPSQLQSLALQFSEKVTALLEANERLLDSRSGKYKDSDWKTKQVGWHDRGDGQRRHQVGSGDGRRAGVGPGRISGRSGRGHDGRGSGRGGRGIRRPIKKN